MAKESKNLTAAEKLEFLSKCYKTTVDVEFLDTKSIVLNMLFGGGLPTTKNIQIYSESGLGKSTVVAFICKSLCQQGYKILYIDAEGALNDGFLRSMGILTDDENNLLYNKDTNPEGPFVVFQVSYFEDIENILEELLPKYDSKGLPMTSDYRLVVFDSVNAMVPKEYRGDSNEKLSVTSNKIGMFSRPLSNFLKKFNGYKTAYNISFIYINQLREQLSLDYSSKYKDNVPGGKAMEYYSDIIVKINSGELIKSKVETKFGSKEEVPTRREVKVISKKNKITDSNISLPLMVVFGKGISQISTYFYILCNKKIQNAEGSIVNVIEQSGAWFSLTFYDENNTPQTIRCNGKSQLYQAMGDNLKNIVKLIFEEDYKKLYNIIEEDYSDVIN